jgi:TolA-binding protein
MSGCAIINGQPAKKDGPTEHLAVGQKLLAGHDYEGALKEWRAVIFLSSGKPPSDKALFYMGQTYGDPQNGNRDFSKAIESFQQLIKEYPRSTHAESARVWMENLEEQEKLKRAVSESLQESERVKRLWNDALQENERLKRRANEYSQENARLKKVVEQSKSVDVEMDEKKRNQQK